MFTKNELSRINQTFWTRFGKYMHPIPNAEGEYINWVNYKTGVAAIYFRMDVDRTSAQIAIEIQHKDQQIQEEIFLKLQRHQKLLAKSSGETWQWSSKLNDTGNRIISRVYLELKNVSVTNQSDWPLIISFLKHRIIALDSFWHGAAGPATLPGGVEVVPAERAVLEAGGSGAGHQYPHRISWFTSAPTPNENGRMNPIMARPVFHPRSFRIMKKLAMQGRNSVMVTSATTTSISIDRVMVPAAR